MFLLKYLCIWVFSLHFCNGYNKTNETDFVRIVCFYFQNNNKLINYVIHDIYINYTQLPIILTIITDNIELVSTRKNINEKSIIY